MNGCKCRQRRQTYGDYQVEGCTPERAVSGQAAGFITACTEPLNHRHRDDIFIIHMMNNAEHGHTATSPCAIQGKPTVRQAHEGAVVRGWKKQKPFCNGVDRTCNMVQLKGSECLSGTSEKAADVQLVFHCERVWRIFRGGNANDGC